jgi:hypothetical protein
LFTDDLIITTKKRRGLPSALASVFEAAGLI